MFKDEEFWRYPETDIDQLRKERDAYRVDARESQQILKGISVCFGNIDCPTAQMLMDHFPFVYEALRLAHHHILLKQIEAKAGREGRLLSVTVFENTKGTDFPRHKDSRLCTLSVSDQELLVSCTCGRTKKYYSGEEIRHAFICNGIVILRHHKNSLPQPGHFQTEEPS